MLKVTFQAPIIVSPDHLPALLALVGAPAFVEVVSDGSVPAPLNEIVKAPDPAPEPAAAEAPAKATRRGRPPKSASETPVVAESAPQAVPETPAEPAAAAAPATTGPATAAVDAITSVAGPLIERFTALVDKSYDDALRVLEGFGIARFSDLKPEDHPAMAKALAEYGV